MESFCQEIGIAPNHCVETSVTGRYLVICDKKWLQTLEKQNLISNFPIHHALHKKAHPSSETPLEHPWTRIMVQMYAKKPQANVFPLPGLGTNDLNNDKQYEFPYTYSQAVSYVANTNFKNLWESAYKRYQAAHVKFCKPGGMKTCTNTNGNCIPYDAMLKELVQRIYHCPLINCKVHRLKEAAEGQADDVENKGIH